MPFGVRRPSGCYRRLYSNTIRFVLLGLTLVVLSACGLVPEEWKPGASGSQGTPQTSRDINPRELARPVETGSPLSVDPVAPDFTQNANSGPLAGVRPFEPRPHGSLGALGLNLETYLSEDLDTRDRISRLENTVLAIHNDLKKMAPSIQRLVAIEGDIQELVSQLEMLMLDDATARAAASPAPGNMGRQPPSAAAGTPKPLTPMHQAQDAPVIQASKSYNSSGGNSGRAPPGTAQVKGLRIGEHKDKTRIVLDVSGPAPYRYDLDNSENLLVVELPGTGWAGRQSWSGKSPLLSSYSVSPMDDGSRLIVQLKHGASVVYESVIKPNGNNHYRIVIDLKSPAVHQ